MKPATQRSPQLYGETLVWVSYDRDRVASAALRVMLLDRLQSVCLESTVRLETIVAVSLEEALVHVEQQRAGLLTLALSREDDETAVWRLLRRVKLRRPQCVRCVYVGPTLDEGKSAGELPAIDRLRLLETGAQIVIEQIPWYSAAAQAIVSNAPRRTGGSHPLTVGLVDRLPWP